MKKLIVFLIVMLFILGGCGKPKEGLEAMSKEELIGMVDTQAGEIEELSKKVEDMDQMMKKLYGEDVPKVAIDKVGNGDNRYTFRSFKGDIYLDSTLGYPGSEQAPNTASLNITKSLSVVPTSNWVVRINGTTSEFEHTSGVSGVIKAGSIKEIGDKTKFEEEVFKVFFEGIKPENVKYSKIFLEDNWWGLEANANVLVDGERAVMRCGVYGMGEHSVTYMFVYKGNEDSVKAEAVGSLLKTMKLFNQQVRIEE